VTGSEAGGRGGPRRTGPPGAAAGSRRPGVPRRARDGGPGGGDGPRGRTRQPGDDHRSRDEPRFRNDPGGRRAAGGRGGPSDAARRPGRDTRPPGGGRAGGRVPPRTALRRGSPARRLQVTLLCIGFALSLVAGRLVQLQGLDGSKYQALAEHQRLDSIPEPAVRGSITTSDGTTLAMSVPTDLVFADPPLITAAKASPAAVAAALAGPLGMTQSAILALLQNPTSKDYVVLKQVVSSTVGARIAALNEPGIRLTSSYTRAYPNGDLAANIVGFTNSDSAGDLRGEAGIEQSYNSLLAGKDGLSEVEVGTTGQPIPVGEDKTQPMMPGGNVRLTIQADIQYVAEQACAAQVRKVDAANCTAVVMQPGTGKILALAQAPSFNPAQPASVAATADIPVSDVFDPGSTAKVITVAAALEQGGQTPMTPYTIPDQIVVDGFPFHDGDYHPTERLTVAGILAHSSNVGMVQVVQHVPPQVQYQYYKAFGIGEPSGLGLPAASNGLLYPPSKWWGDERYTMAFGQGVAVTAVQMASVYATIANGGVRVEPSIVAGTTNASGQFVPAQKPASHRVLKTTTASELMAILQQVPYLDATLAYQPWGEIPGYSIASKTGTAQIANAAGCLCTYGSSYIGIGPASAPQLVVAVNVQDPRKGGYFGNEVAGPVFNKIMKFALQTLKIPPDGAKRPDVRLTAP
jgi:cell division protein FtsI (penicillin-binding protein 3)